MMKRLSVQEALRKKKAYTNKLGTTIPYKELKGIIKLNRAYEYQAKKVEAKETNRKIKVSTLNKDYAKRVKKLRNQTNYFRWLRMKQKVKTGTIKTEKTLKKITRKIKVLEKQITNQSKVLNGADTNIDLNFDNISNLKSLDINKITLFKNNLMSSIGTIYSDTGISEYAFNKIMEAIDTMGLDKLHALATDERVEVIEYIYNDPTILSARLLTLINTVERAIGNKIFTEAELSTIVNDFAIGDTNEILSRRF